MMNFLVCRLCSATTSLISLFNGKNRKSRDIIRKLTSETVNIQFEDGDLHSCICYSCVVQVYNTYIFQVRSKENEDKLQNNLHGYEELYKSKHIIIPLKEISLPTIDFLQGTFKTWLQEKLKIITEELIENGVASFEEQTNPSQELFWERKMREVCQPTDTKITQTSIETKDATLQTTLDVNYEKLNVHCQTEVVMQDKIFESSSVKDNNDLTIEKENKSVQCYFPEQPQNGVRSQGESDQGHCEMRYLVNYLVKLLPNEYQKNRSYDINKFDAVYHGLDEEIKKVLCGTKSKFLAEIGLISKDDNKKEGADGKCKLCEERLKTDLKNKSVQCNLLQGPYANNVDTCCQRTFTNIIKKKLDDTNKETENKSCPIPKTSSNMLGVSRSICFSPTCTESGLTLNSKPKVIKHKKLHKQTVQKVKHRKENMKSNCELHNSSKRSLKINIVKLDDSKIDGKLRKRKCSTNVKKTDESPKKKKYCSPKTKSC